MWRPNSPALPTPAPRPLAPGTDGCGAPMLVLLSAAPAADNSVVSPTASTYTRLALASPSDLVLRAADGSVIPPTAAEAAAAAASPAPDTAWLGCIVAGHAIMAGNVAGVVDGVPSALACCRACRARGAAACNVWNYCAEPGGCAYTTPSNRSVSLRTGQCELRYNVAADLAMGEPGAALPAARGFFQRAGLPARLLLHPGQSARAA